MTSAPKTELRVNLDDALIVANKTGPQVTGDRSIIPFGGFLRGVAMTLFNLDRVARS